jgi:hypothetical protein
MTKLRRTQSVEGRWRLMICGQLGTREVQMKHGAAMSSHSIRNYRFDLTCLSIRPVWDFHPSDPSEGPVRPPPDIFKDRSLRRFHTQHPRAMRSPMFSFALIAFIGLVASRPSPNPLSVLHERDFQTSCGLISERPSCEDGFAAECYDDTSQWVCP